MPAMREEDQDQANSYSQNSPASSFTVRSVRYGECRRNHAAGIGGYALDGCREFMASGEDGTEAAMSCAACGCHRSYHRRVVETEVVADCVEGSYISDCMSNLSMD